MSIAVTKIGPGDHGRHMSLAEFDLAEGQGGFLYELARGVVTVVDVPRPEHFDQIDAIQDQLRAYKTANPGQIHRIGEGSDCKILLADLNSERHPDLSVYKTPRPISDDEVWSIWIPELVIEVVSPGSEQRDYVEKREEYLAFGVKEYWIVDAQRQEVLVLQRRGGQWNQKVLRPGEIYEPPLFPGLRFDCRPVLQAPQI